MKIILFIGAILLAFIGSTQQLTFNFSGQITNADTKKSEAGVTVSIIGGGKTLASSQTASNGKYDFETDAPLGGIIQVVFSKAGFVSKKIDINTSKVNVEDLPPGDVQDMILPGELFTEKPDIDFSFLKTEPVALFFWDEVSHSMSLDPSVSSKSKKKIADALAAGAGNAAATDAKYKAAIDAGAALMNQKKYEEALSKYEAALIIKPKEALPTQKISELDKLIKDQKSANLAGQQAELEYKNLISAADNLRDQKKYQEASTKYSEALKKKSDPYPTGEINKLTGLIADQKSQAAKDLQFDGLKKEGMDLALAKKWSESKTKLNQALAIKADPVITAKIKEIDIELGKAVSEKEKSDKYNLLMSTADGFLVSGKLNEAKTKYTEALTLDPSQTLPKTKIAEVNDLIAKKSVNSAKQLKIDKLILEGNTAFAKNDLAGSKIKFEEVLKEDAANEIAKSKLKEIIAKLDSAKGQAEKDAQFDALKKEGMALVASKKWNEAKIKLEQAIGIKPDAGISQKLVEIQAALQAGQSQAALEEDFKRLMSEASTQEGAKNYDAAILKYKEASSKKPAEVLPRTKISELEKLKASLASSNQAEVQKTALYNSHMAKGNKNLADKKYALALTDFQNALAAKSGDAAAQGKISETQQILDDLANANSKKTEVKKNFDKAMSDAKKLFDQKKYVDAKKGYEQALTIIENEPTALKQVSECQRLSEIQSGNEVNVEYKKIVAAADRKFNDKDYLKAKDYYERALKLRLTDPYPKSKLDEIERLLNPSAPIIRQDIKPEKLEALGVPFLDSEAAARAELEKAEIARKTAKNQDFKNSVQVVTDFDANRTAEKQEQSIATTRTVSEIQEEVIARSDANIQDHSVVIELIKEVIKVQTDKNEQEIAFENSDHQKIDENFDLIEEENSADYLSREGVFVEKGDLIKKHNAEYSDLEIKRTKEYQDKNVSTKVSILQIEESVIDHQKDDTESRIAVDERIEKAVLLTIETEHEKSTDKKNQILRSEIEITEAQKNTENQGLVDKVNAVETLTDLATLKQNVNNTNEKATSKDEADGMNVTASMVELNKNISEQEVVNKGTQQASNTMFQQAHKDIEDADVIAYNNDMLKHLKNKNSLKEKTADNSQSTIASNEKLIANNLLIKDRANLLDDQNVEQGLINDQKHLDAAKSIHDKQNEENMEKPIVANALGAEYPEGVSQEVFSVNDENGLMKSIVTRRVVVVGGKGSVYVKTETTTVTTFSKNNSPTTQNVWQKETQGPNLKKNY